jgi:hypothetical protein
VALRIVAASLWLGLRQSQRGLAGARFADGNTLIKAT